MAKEAIPKDEFWHFVIIVVGLVMFWVGFILGWAYTISDKYPIINNIGAAADY